MTEPKKRGRKKGNGKRTVTITGRVEKYHKAFVETHFESFSEFLRVAIENKMDEYRELGLIDDGAWEAPKKETPEEAFKKWVAEQDKH